MTMPTLVSSMPMPSYSLQVLFFLDQKYFCPGTLSCFQTGAQYAARAAIGWTNNKCSWPSDSCSLSTAQTTYGQAISGSSSFVLAYRERATSILTANIDKRDKENHSAAEDKNCFRFI